MVSVPPHIFRFTGVPVSGQGEMLSTLFTALQTDGHSYLAARSMTDLKHHCSSNNIDVIITGDSADKLRQINKIIIAQKPSNRPILCVITDADAPPPHTANADVVLPNIPTRFIERALYRQLELRNERIQNANEQDAVTLLKNAIVRNVSHELKTPLLQVKSAVALIAEDDPDGKLPEMAVQATARLEAVIKNITLLADSLRGSFGPVLVHESIEHAIRHLRRIWIHKHDITRIIVDIDDDVPPVLGDQQGIGIVLQRLLDNALKFSKDNVYVSASREGDRVKISVRDTGIGIADDQVKQIFDPFYQVDSSSTRRFSGTGAGLAIVRLMMEKHGTEIRVESKLGEGSTFSFTLPEAKLS